MCDVRNGQQMKPCKHYSIHCYSLINGRKWSKTGNEECGSCKNTVRIFCMLSVGIRERKTFRAVS